MHTYTPTDPDCVDCSPYFRDCKDRCHRKERTCTICTTVVRGKMTYCDECLKKVIKVIINYNQGLNRYMAVYVPFSVDGPENERIQKIIWNIPTSEVKKM